MLSEIWSFVVTIYTYPVYTWRGGCTGTDGNHYATYRDIPRGVWGTCQYPDKAFASFTGFFVYGISFVVLTMILVRTWRAIDWRIHRVRCQHTECGNTYTWPNDRLSKGAEPGCIAGSYCCDDCSDRHEYDAFLRKVHALPHLKCPSCKTRMNKDVDGYVVVDNCPNCGGAFLHKGTRQQLEEIAWHQGYNDGRRSDPGSSLIMAGAIAGFVAAMA